MIRLQIFIIISLIFSNVMAEDTMRLLKTNMDYIAARQAILSENVASVNVSQYKAKDIKPQTIHDLRHRSKIKSFSLVSTSPMHLKKKVKIKSEFKIFNPRTTDVRKNGNDVELDEEMIKLSDNSNKFNLTTKIYAQLNNLIKSQVAPK